MSEVDHELIGVEKTWVGEPYDDVLATGENITPARSEVIFLMGGEVQSCIHGISMDHSCHTCIALFAAEMAKGKDV